jgi:hypothetical protein
MKRIACNGIGMGLAVALLGLVAVAQNQPEPSSQNGAAASSLGDYARQTRNNSGAKTKPKVFDNDNLPTGDKLSIVGTEAPPAPTTAEASTETKSEEAKPEVKVDAAKAEETKSEEAKPEESGKPAGKANHVSPEGKPKTEAAGTGDQAKSEAKAEVKAAEAKPASAANPDEDAAAKQAAWKQWNDRITTQKEQIDLADRELNVTQREYQVRAAAMYGDVGNRLRNSADWDKQDAQYKQQIADKQKALDDARQKLDDMQEDARKAGVPESMREPQ